MKFQFVKEVEGKVLGYDGVMVTTGDVVEYDGHFAQKAMRNKDYQAVGETVPMSEPAAKPAKKKSTR